ncbi:MAG: MgtC/SapB family protein [Actinobacteria bacterium]|nr:MgtC/SapB family protein [Actinomycetota bacterium]MBV8957794.1 MgtC/SapB family protein [Actinomycetota bacterium]MBV9254435.1 MgtC/SapB family protein [Actinomycetota bacterium]MBV9664278.1 MgtC/SapB family protein [Actinomycetota bacterium]MBV9934187.1 MgtC/SapB family protein [Actinomycetota bacterium]
MSHGDVLLFYRIAVGAMLSFVLGWEREVRGAPAGDRTYSLVGTASAAVTAVTIHSSPQAVGGVVTGIGFVGAALVFRSLGGTLRGVTSAATVFAAAAIGIVAGAGHLVLALLTTAFVLLILELRNIPVLRLLDSRRYADRMKSDETDDYPDAPEAQPPA